MKRIITLITATAMLAALTSCSKDDDAAMGECAARTGKVTVTAGFEGSTKVGYAETDSNKLHPYWEINDNVIGITDDNITFTLRVKSIMDDGRAVLESVDDAPQDANVHLVYRSGISKDEWKSGAMPVDYGEQAGDRTMPALMFSNGTIVGGSGSFTFNNAGAVIGIDNAKGLPAGAEISRVVIYGENLSKVDVSISGNALVLTAAEKQYDEVSVSGISGITAGDDDARTLSSPIIIALPAGAEVAKVSIFFEGSYDPYSYTLKTRKEVAANKYLYIRSQNFVRDDFVDLGLPSKLLWHTHNIGAEKPGDYGNYYAWGETETWYESIAFNTTGLPITMKEGYSGGFANSTYKSKAAMFGINANLTGEYASNDVAYSCSGGEMRMPTSGEWLELANNCYMDIIPSYGGVDHKGIIVYRVTNDADKGKISHGSVTYNPVGEYSLAVPHIFIPYTGFCKATDLGSGDNESRSATIKVGYYWTSDYTYGSAVANQASRAAFSNAKPNVHNSWRCYGLPVRAVKEAQE